MSPSMKRKFIKVLQPLAKTGQRVSVFNYRRKSMQVWESGTVMSYEYSYAFGEDGYWLYRVRLDRPNPHNHPIQLTVGDENIKLLKV